ncbi:hypothetical protein F0562_009130 [Nyssa sinensis]|uniref:Protein kinase domain-containing protein n=1 Tax=Nyssa sinensis TaxID=561372 RepID=A0A5J4ZYA2_9ASTE|nr:hypothetical protein F0562_009130 [Nyssa sinensis]
MYDRYSFCPLERLDGNLQTGGCSAGEAETFLRFRNSAHPSTQTQVRLIGYCIEGSLFLVYEFIENGNLNQHLRGSGRDPLPWSTRVQIALDSARGLEYIHEHTVPVYIHLDIKSANILIDKNFHAKADKTD